MAELDEMVNITKLKVDKASKELENAFGVMNVTSNDYHKLLAMRNDQVANNLSAIPGIADSLGSINTWMAVLNGRQQGLEQLLKNEFELVSQQLQILMQPAPSLPHKPKCPIYLRIKNPPADPLSLGFSPLAMEDDDRRMFQGWNKPGYVQPGPQASWDRMTIARMCDDHRSWGRDGIIIDIEPSATWDFSTQIVIDRLAELHELIRANGMRTGHYGGLLEGTQSYWGPVNKYFYPGNPQTWDKWVKDNDTFKPITGNLDVLCPTLYDHYDIFERWVYFAFGNIQECLRLNPGKPVVPLVSPSIAGESSKGPCKSFVRQLQWLKRNPLVKGIIIWDMTLPGVAWDDNADWVKEVAA